MRLSLKIKTFRETGQIDTTFSMKHNWPTASDISHMYSKSMHDDAVTDYQQRLLARFLQRKSKIRPPDLVHMLEVGC